MKRIFALFIAGCLAWVPVPALAGSSMTDLGSAAAGSGLTLTLTLSNNVTGGAGGAIVGLLDIHNTPGTVTAHDSQGNCTNYTQAAAVAAGTERYYYFVCINPTHSLTSGTDTITFASSSGTISMFAIAAVLTGTGTLTTDTIGAWLSGATMSSNTLSAGHAGVALASQPATLVAPMGIITNSGSWQVDTTNGWTLGPQHSGVATPLSTLGFQYKDVTLTTAVPFKPGYSGTGTSVAASIDEAGYDTAAGAAVGTRRSLTGAGQ